MTRSLASSPPSAALISMMTVSMLVLHYGEDAEGILPRAPSIDVILIIANLVAFVATDGHDLVKQDVLPLPLTLHRNRTTFSTSISRKVGDVITS